MKQNKYFKESEFKCKCGKCELPQNVPSDELINLLVEIREFFGNKVLINSGYRCKTHNKKVGGATNSQHTIGSAVDFRVEGVDTQIVFHHCIKMYGDRPLGIAVKINKDNPMGGFVHLDTRGKKARWEYK